MAEIVRTVQTFLVKFPAISPPKLFKWKEEARQKQIRLQVVISISYRSHLTSLGWQLLK